MDAGVFERLKVWTWGRNTVGQLGTGTYAGIMIPELNQTLDRRRIQVGRTCPYMVIINTV